jgi:hypothetical protein
MSYSNVYPAIRTERLGEIFDAGVEGDTSKNEWNYVTTDSLATVEAAGYFPTPANGGPNFSRGDRVVVIANLPSGNPLTGGPAQEQDYVVALGPNSGDASTVLIASQGRSQVGSSQGIVGASGNLTPNVAPTTAGLTPAATGGDYTVSFIAVPGAVGFPAFDKAGRQLYIQAIGGFAANANNKNAKLWASNTLPVVGATVASATKIADLGTLATSAQGWVIEAQIIKYGALGSNTQFGLHLPSQPSTNGLLVPAALTLTENAPIYIAATINNATAPGDTYLDALIATWSN